MCECIFIMQLVLHNKVVKFILSKFSPSKFFCALLTFPSSELTKGNILPIWACLKCQKTSSLSCLPSSLSLDFSLNLSLFICARGMEVWIVISDLLTDGTNRQMPLSLYLSPSLFHLSTTTEAVRFVITEANSFRGRNKQGHEHRRRQNYCPTAEHCSGEVIIG